MADAEQTIRGFFVASSLLVSTVSVVPYSHARENAPSLTQRFVSNPQSDFLGFETRSTKSRGGERARDELARVVAGPSKSSSHYTYVYAGNVYAPRDAAHKNKLAPPRKDKILTDY